MDSLQKCFWIILSLLVFLTDPGFGFYILEGPRNLTALAGTDAHFNCTVSEGWQILIWQFEGKPVLSVSPDKVYITDNNYNQQGYNKTTEFTSELTIYNIQLNNSGRIDCSIQTLSGNQYAFLSVQVNGSLNIKDHNMTVRENQTIEIVCEAVRWNPSPHITWMLNNITVDNSNYVTNQTQVSNGLYNEESILTLTPLTNSTVICLAAILALSKPQSATMTLVVYPPPIESDAYEDNGRTRTIILAVVLSIVGFLLLILIIVLIVCCYRRRKEPNYQKKMRTDPVKKNATDQNLETRSESGNENYGYSPDEQERTNQIPRLSPFSRVDSTTYSIEQDLEVGSASKVPYGGNYDRVLPSRATAYPTNPRKIRNVTLV